MDFALSPEQTELVATIRQLLERRSGSAAVRAAIASPRGYDEDLWQVMCEQVGVAALAIPEAYDGFGATLFESVIVLEELGRNLAPSPLLGTLIATEALLAGGAEDARRDLLPRIAAGTSATIDLGGPVLDADRATILLALDHTDRTDLVLCDAAATTWTESMDQTIRIGAVSGGDRTVIGDGSAARDRASLVAAVAAAAQAVGLCQRALDMTVAYSKERVQFGRPIGSFQALKHRMADMLARTELARSLTWSAAYALAGGTTEDGREQVHLAASYALESASALAGECIQLHGGIAITWEHDAHLVFKRAHALGQLVGAPHLHRASVAL